MWRYILLCTFYDCVWPLANRNPRMISEWVSDSTLSTRSLSKFSITMRTAFSPISRKNLKVDTTSCGFEIYTFWRLQCRQLRPIPCTRIIFEGLAKNQNQIHRDMGRLVARQILLPGPQSICRNLPNSADFALVDTKARTRRSFLTTQLQIGLQKVERQQDRVQWRLWNKRCEERVAAIGGTFLLSTCCKLEKLDKLLEISWIR